MNYLSLILFLFLLNPTHINAMPKNINGVNKTAPDSLHKVWKFKTLEPVPGSKGGMGSIEDYDLWDLTKMDTLSYTTKDSVGIFHSKRYKIINNAIVPQLPNNEGNNNFQFRISKLTGNLLKLILNITYNVNGVVKNEDVIILVFEAVNK